MNLSIIPIFGFILNRDNDLAEFFWPILHFAKQQILVNHQIPLWNNLFLAGTPLVADPQAPIFYPFNLLAILIPLDVFFIVSFIFHIVVAGLGIYLVSKDTFKFSRKTSIILALLYAFTPRLGAYLEAGHVGLVYTLAWIPFALWASLKLRNTPSIKHSILLAVPLALLYFSHLPTFLIIAFSFGLLALNKKSFLFVGLGALLTFGLIAVSFLPQLVWQGNSTRYLLLESKDVYPKWTSIWEAGKSVFVANLDTEKSIVLGSAVSLLSFLGFIKLGRKQKLLFAGLALTIFLVILNNASPLYPILLNQKWYLLLRVSTRFWILILPLSLYLVGFALEKYKGKLIYFLALAGILESIFWGVTYLRKPINQNLGLAPKGVYEFLAKDLPAQTGKSIFRVYCLDRCLSQKETAIYGLELLDGYSTVQQTNFYKHAWGLTGAYWNYYTLSIPPFGADTKNPDVASLGTYNVKYLISKTPLTDINLVLKDEVGDYKIYENLAVKPRNYEIYTPNFIRVRTSDILNPSSYILPEVYSPGWKAFLNGKKEVPVQETPNALRAVDITGETTFVDFRYAPETFILGEYITFSTLALLTGYGIFQISKKSKKGRRL